MPNRPYAARWQGAGRKLFVGLMIAAAFSVAVPFSLTHLTEASGGQVLFEITGPFIDSAIWGRHIDTAVDVIAEKYIPPATQTLCAVGQKIAQLGGNTGSADLEVREGGINPDFSTLVATSSIPASALPTDTLNYTMFELPNCVTLTAGQTYWFKWTNSGPQYTGYISAYRNSDQFPNSSFWQVQTYAFPPVGWVEYPNREWSLRLEGPPSKEPVIIVPGIMGTRLNRAVDNENTWIGGIKLASPSDDYLDEIKLDVDGTELPGKASIPVQIVDEELGKIVYENLVSVFEQDGYVSGTSLFEVPYDWRLDLQEEVIRLNAKILQAISNSPTGKVNIIAHSMGGLLVKEYLVQASSTSFIGKLLLVGSPQLGAPKTFKVLNDGDDMGMRLFGLGLNQSKVKEISQNMPGVYELLPSRRYIDVNGGYVEDFRSTGSMRALTYDETDDFMLENPADSRNPFMLDLTDQFHVGLDNSSINAPNVYNIVGCQNSETLGRYRIYDDDKIDITIAEGDGTVPLTSAMNLGGGYSATYFVRHDQTGIDHMGLVKDNRAVDLIKAIVADEIITLPQGFSTSTNYCFDLPPQGQNETTIMVSTHSPVELHAYDDQNRHTGPLSNGDIELGIPGSSYEKIGENSFIFVPTGVDYRFVADGLSVGSFDMKVRGYVGSNLDTTVTYLAVPLAGSQTNAELDVTDMQLVGDLKLDADGNGTFETNIPPTAILSATSSADIVPPVVTIISPTGADYLRSQIVPILFTAADAGAGVALTNAYLDTLVTTSTALDFFFGNLGSHTFSVHAVDLVGNPAHASVAFQVIATPSSTIADIHRAYTLDWIRDLQVAKILKKNMERASRPDGTVQQTALNTFLTELEFWHNEGAVNENAYNVLKEDAEWLLNN